MVKRNLVICLVLGLLFGGWILPANSFGQTTANITVNASVSDCVDFTWGVKKILYEFDEIPRLNWEEDLTKMSMNFGDDNGKLLIVAEDKEGKPFASLRLFSPYGYVVILWIAADEPYHIKQTFESLYNRTTQDPGQNLDNSFIVIPEYNPEDKLVSGGGQGELDSNELASPNLVKNFNNPNSFLFYGKDAKSHILRLQYCLPADSSISGWQPILASQAAGEYRGSVIITITPQS